MLTVKGNKNSGPLDLGPIPGEPARVRLHIGAPCPACGQIVKPLAKTNAERQRAYRARKTRNDKPMTATEIRQREKEMGARPSPARDALISPLIEKTLKIIEGMR